MVSVICPIFNEERYIHKCIESVLAQDYPKDDMEVLFVDGMSTDTTRHIVAQYAAQYPFIHLLDNPHKIVPYAMNLGIQQAKGDIIVRLDAHAEYPSDYISKLKEGLKRYDAENVGGVCRTMPANDTSKAIAISAALCSPFGVGNSMFRIGVNHDMEVDTVPFGCFPKSVFDRVGFYDCDLIRNQDDELNARIINSGGKIVLLADIEIKYFARENFSKLYAMYYQYGLYKPLVNKKLGSPATIRQMIPPLFVFGILFGFFLCLLFPYVGFVYLLGISLYFSVGCYIGLQQAKEHRKLSLFFLLPCAFLILHIGYGIGYWHGLAKLLFKRSFNVEVSR